MQPFSPKSRPKILLNFYVVCQKGNAPYTLVSELSGDGVVVSRKASHPMPTLAVPHCFANDISGLVNSAIAGTVARHLVPTVN